MGSLQRSAIYAGVPNPSTHEAFRSGRNASACRSAAGHPCVPAIAWVRQAAENSRVQERTWRSPSEVACRAEAFRAVYQVELLLYTKQLTWKRYPYGGKFGGMPDIKWGGPA